VVSGTDITVTTGAGTSVTGGKTGIIAANRNGNGVLTVTANGDVTGTIFDGIFAQNNGTDLIVTTAAGTTVTGGRTGIYAHNVYSATLTITTNGDVTGTTGAGIYAWNSNTAGTGPLTITTEGVTGGTSGIFAKNGGTGALTIVANGDVTGTSTTGIDARNYNVNSTTLDITSYGSVTGGGNGIQASNTGTGGTTVTAHGDVVGRNDIGIFADNLNGFDAYGIGLSITAENVTGGQFGIVGRNYSAGALRIVANGDVEGTSDTGIFAKNAGNRPIDITVGPGARVAGGVVGVQFVQGGTNSLKNYGTVTNLFGVSGFAIGAGYGNEAIENFGIVTGIVDLGTGANAFNNRLGGVFNSGTVVSVGSGNFLTNSGILSPGGGNTVLTTSLEGEFTQTSQGVFAVDLQGAAADRVDGNGSAGVAGKVKPLFTLSGLGSATQWTVLTTASTPIVDNGIGVVAPPAVNFKIVFPTPTEMELIFTGVNFALAGLNRNETAIAENLNAVYGAGSGGLVSLLDALAALPSVGAIAGALEQLSAEIYRDSEIATLFSSLSFTNSLMTCPVRDGAAAFIKEGECVWARLSGREFEQDATFQTFGFEETSFEVAGGVQGALGDVWRIGFAGAYEHGSLDTDQTFATSDSDRAHAGAVLKYNPGPLLLAAAVSGGWGWYDTERPINFTGFSALAKSDSEIGYLDGRFRAAYQLGAGSWYAKPMVDLDATHVRLDSVSESRAGGVGLNVRGNDETVLSATPALEIGAQFGGPAGTLLRPYIRGGATFFDAPDFVLLASFEGAPSGVGPFRIATQTDDVVADVSAGIDVIGTDGASFRLYYDGRFSDLIEEHAGGIKASLLF
jgi:uncharacterized protein with beta-barrel porin domain